jgi:hypothetical protein
MMKKNENLWGGKFKWAKKGIHTLDVFDENFITASLPILLRHDSI